MARACKGRRSNSPHRHRLQYETQFEGHRYGWIAAKTPLTLTRERQKTQPTTSALISVRLFTLEAEKNKQNQR
ncbi:hypothetical protein NKH85_33615, partial [Mesorhizobium sp. M0924]|uniref:hypothetical protein n=1 Tax=unclassified Mesorhizobium TaxID=325217 RepID=UPI0033371F2C